MIRHEANQQRNISATTNFSLNLGGYYAISVLATWNSSGTVTLERLMPDGTTYVAVGASTTFSANGSVVVQLPPGQYQWTIATATAVYASAVRVPVE